MITVSQVWKYGAYVCFAIAFLAFLYLLALVFTGCATPPAGFRPLPQRWTSSAPRADAGTNYAQPAFLGVIPWQYAPGSSNFCWQLQSSTNLADWVDLPAPCLTDPVTVAASNSFLFFRLKGIQ